MHAWPICPFRTCTTCVLRCFKGDVQGLCHSAQALTVGVRVWILQAITSLERQAEAQLGFCRLRAPG